MSGRALVVRGDARALPLPDASVDLVVTSPPFYALRSYTDGGVHYEGQIGSEPTPAEYIATLLDCTREWVRVLKPSGSLFVNLGDKYGGAQWETKHGQGARQIKQRGGSQSGPYIPSGNRVKSRAILGTRHKSLLGLPWRYALGCIDQLGLILRAEIVWHKPNGLPESVTDRVRRSHEQWFHFTRQPRYYAAVDEIREPASDYVRPNGNGRNPRGGQRPRMMLDTCNPLGRLPGSVWTIPTEPLRVPDHLGIDHFAAFPLAWPLRLIAGWSPPGICTGCGEGRRPVCIVDRVHVDYTLANSRATERLNATGGAITGGTDRSTLGHQTSRSLTGYACGCPQPTAPTRPSVIVDPFGGTGTTALAARALGRTGISIDQSADYCRMAAWRTTDPGELAKAMRVERPPVQVTGQTSLFDTEVV
jgi:DNA modification methylase